MREMKWHIFNEDNNPLCLEDRAIEFDTEEEAVDFFLTFFGEITKENCPNIVQGILYYDGGYCHYPEEVLGYV